MKYEVTITYTWWKDDHKEILGYHQESLEEHAEERIALELSKGYQSGELLTSIFDNSPNEIGYTGWWSKKTKTIE